jgi:putative lipoic acid-binding regulatory protein
VKELPSIEALEAAHDFPCRYVVKAFGPNTEAFADEAHEVAGQVIGANADIKRSVRPSRAGRHACVTLDVYAHSAEQVRTRGSR